MSGFVLELLVPIALGLLAAGMIGAAVYVRELVRNPELRERQSLGERRPKDRRRG